MARTSVSDPTPRSTPPAPPPDPERVRDGNGCGSSLTEAWRPLERGAEALEGVGVPELMEGAGPAPGTRTPRLPGGWMRQTGRKSKYPVSSVPQIHSLLQRRQLLTCWHKSFHTFSFIYLLLVL